MAPGREDREGDDRLHWQGARPAVPDLAEMRHQPVELLQSRPAVAHLRLGDEAEPGRDLPGILHAGGVERVAPGRLRDGDDGAEMNEAVGDGLRLSAGGQLCGEGDHVGAGDGRAGLGGDVAGLDGGEHLRFGPPDGASALGDVAVDHRAQRRILRLLSGHCAG